MRVKKTFAYTAKAVFALALLWNLALGAKLAAKNEENKDSIESAFEKMQLLAEILYQIRENYVDEDKTDFNELLYGAMRGIVQSLDPHSQFMDPDMFQDMQEDTAGEFGGLGIVIGLRDSNLTVVSPMDDTPAFRAGIHAGDRIIEVEGESTDGMSLYDAVRLLRGEPGTRVSLKLMDPKTLNTRDVEIVRAIIKVQSVKDSRVIEESIGYTRLTQFNEPTAETLEKEINKLLAQGMQSFILDLRNNPGGLLNSAVQVSQLFLKKGDLIVSTKGRKGVQYSFKSKGDKHFKDLPMVLLVNEGSASASEIVAGALQDHKRAVIVGEKTFGKGSVQSVLPMMDGSAVRLTTAKYFTPNGRSIHEKGIIPDIIVPMSQEQWHKILRTRVQEAPEEMTDTEDSAEPPAAPEQLDAADDPQMQRAIDLLKGIKVFMSTAGNHKNGPRPGDSAALRP